MTSDAERRRSPRFVVPDATLEFALEKEQADLEALTDAWPVLNLCREGVCFLSNRWVKRDARLCLALRVPDLPNAIELTGETRWLMRTYDSGYHAENMKYELEIGVEFVPFTGGLKENAPEVLEILRDLETKYL